MPDFTSVATLLYFNDDYLANGGMHQDGDVFTRFGLSVSQHTHTFNDSPGVDGTTDGIWTFGEQLDEVTTGLYAGSNDAEFLGVVSTPFGPGVIIHDTFNLGTNPIYVHFEQLAGANWALANLSTFTLDDSQTFTECFAAGTMIATPAGEVAVETLKIGDMVTTAEGREVPVKWLGQQTRHKLFSGARMQPVRIRAGALGDGLPHSDLTVTADHGMVFPSSSKAVGETKNDGYVINASALVNHTSIDFVPMDELEDSFTVYHIETEAHDVILANGAASETYLDIPGRGAFDNYQDYMDLYGTETNIPEMRTYRITTQRLLPEAIKTRLGISAKQMDWDQILTA